jgi:NAD(P)-dependent dehydrogenase (short-subunit alcohol dehydrogenase family)
MSAGDLARVALVAGGSGGVGQTICRRLSADGCAVAVGYRSNIDAAQGVVDDITDGGGRATTVRLDLADAGGVAQAVETTVTTFGGIDTAIYAAGPYVQMHRVGDVSVEMMREVLEGDAQACFTFLQAALPSLRERRGAFITLSTPAARRHVARDVLSSVPKAAIEALVRAVASEEGRQGVRANAVGVGFVEAGMFFQLMERGDFSEKYVEAALKAIPLRRMGTAEDIAEAVAFLADPARAGYITGQFLQVDGGISL